MHWALDIETQDWTTFVLGSAVSESGIVRVFDTREDMARWYLALDKRDIVLAHNGGRFDFLCLIDSLPDKNWIGILAGSGLISCRIVSDSSDPENPTPASAECRDTYRLFPMRLAKWTGAKDELGLPCVCTWVGPVIGGRTIDGPAPDMTCECECHAPKATGCYRSIRLDMPPAMRARCIEYCIQDSRVLLVTYMRDVERAQSEGFNLRDSKGRIRLTIGSMALHTARDKYGAIDGRRLKKDKATNTWRYFDESTDESWDAWNEHDTTRDGYYGGRCEVYETRCDFGGRFDINSAYPWALTQSVPLGRPLYCDSVDATRALACQQPGIYTARVYVPPAMVSPLPMRLANRLIWPFGYLEGSWTRDDLLLALPSADGRIIEVQSAVVYPKEAPLFKSYMEHVFARRQIAAQGADDAWKEWTKLAGNSLSGKLAQGPEMETLRLTDRPHKAWRWLGGRAHVQVNRRPADSARPFQAAALTALPRFQQYRMLTGKCSQSEIGALLGQWKPEGTFTDWAARAPKVYRYHPDDLPISLSTCDGGPVYGDTDSAMLRSLKTALVPHIPTGKNVVKIKGVPDADWDKWGRYSAGERIHSDRGVQGIRSALSREQKAFARRDLDRGSNAEPNIVGSRHLNPDGSTAPLHRREDGTFFWPGHDTDPQEML